MCCYNCMTLFVFSFCCMLDHRIYTSFSKQLLFPNGSWTNCVLILPDVFPHCARGQNVATLGIFCKNCLLLLPLSCCYSLLRRSLFLPCCQEECQVAGLELLFGRPKSCYHPSSIYSWSIGHILEHEFFCLGHLGCSGSIMASIMGFFLKKLKKIEKIGYHSNSNFECYTE